MSTQIANDGIYSDLNGLFWNFKCMLCVLNRTTVKLRQQIYLHKTSYLFYGIHKNDDQKTLEIFNQCLPYQFLSRFETNGISAMFMLHARFSWH